MKALAKEPRARFQTAPDFAAALEAAYQQILKADESTEDLRPKPQPSPPPQEARPVESARPAPAPLPPNPPPRPSYAKPLGAAATLIAALALGSYALWPKSSTAPTFVQPTATLPPVTAAPTPRNATAEGLEIELQIEDENRPLRNCNFALFRPEITTLPPAATPENALVILEGITREEGTKNTEERVAPHHRYKEKVPPGSYYVHFECPSYPVTFAKTTVRKDARHPGLAYICLTLRGKLCQPE